MSGGATLTKSELVQAVSERSPDITRRHAEVVVNTIFGCMREALEKGDRIEIRGFGSFHVRLRGPRTARNPRTGDVVDIDEKRVPFFKVGKELKERVNES